MEELVTRPDPAFWADKRVILTGHTGFKGAWLAFWLKRMGARVTGLALAPADDDLFVRAAIADGMDSRIGDIRDASWLATQIRQADPEIVLHLAAQALVRRSYADPVETFATNVMGTVNLLDACRASGAVRSIVMVTTDKVYVNLEHGLPYRESDTLGGYDPYSASKAASEIAIASFRDSFLRQNGVAMASARAGNVIGGGDWSDDRLIPDAVRAWRDGGTLSIRRPDAVRPWQHVLEPLAGYLILAERLFTDPEMAGAFNFGPYTHEAATVRQVVTLARDAFGGGELVFGTDVAGPHEAGLLTLETTKARSMLGFLPTWSLDQAVMHTMHWYRDFLAGQDASTLCARDILAYGRAR